MKNSPAMWLFLGCIAVGFVMCVISLISVNKQLAGLEPTSPIVAPTPTSTNFDKMKANLIADIKEDVSGPSASKESMEAMLVYVRAQRERGYALQAIEDKVAANKIVTYNEVKKYDELRQKALEAKKKWDDTFK